MKMKSLLKAVSITLLSGLLAAPAFAATQGTVGTTSTGRSDISVTVPKLVNITSVADFNFGSYSGVGDMNLNDDLCIGTNANPRNYRVTVTAQGETAYVVKSGANSLAFHAYFNDVTGTGGEVELTHGTTLSGQTGGSTLGQCIAGTNLNANLHTQFLETDLLAVPDGAYAGTLVILVEPN